MVEYRTCCRGCNKAVTRQEHESCHTEERAADGWNNPLKCATEWLQLPVDRIKTLESKLSELEDDLLIMKHKLQKSGHLEEDRDDDWNILYSRD